MSARDSQFSSRYRYIVVPRGLHLYGVFDRATGKTIQSDLTRAHAREIVRERNNP